MRVLGFVTSELLAINWLAYHFGVLRKTAWHDQSQTVIGWQLQIVNFNWPKLLREDTFLSRL